ncbi:MAG: autoinducer binding domain-containing protein [Smithella sp.]|jgi:DNA-binding CsgD family transcriptional regulator
MEKDKGLKKVLSKKDAITLLELIDASNRVTDLDDFFKLMERLKSIIPYDSAVGALAKMDHNSTITSYETINFNYPSEWLSLYRDKNYHCIDPLIRHNYKYFNVQYWTETYRLYDTPKDFISGAEDFGLRSGCAHGMRNLSGNRGSIFSFAGLHIEPNSRTEIILSYLIPHFHNVIVRILENVNKKSNIMLLPREKEVLNWIKQGKSTWDISLILGISDNTVKYHIKNIFKKLDAVNRIQAVATAVQQGLIDLD